MVAQEDAKDIPFVIRKGDRVPFYWANKLLEKFICIKSVSESLSPYKREQVEFDWSCGFPISELGTLSVQNRLIDNETTRGSQIKQSMYKLFKRHKSTDTLFFRVDRRLHNNTIFIIVEEENRKYPMYRIENFSRRFAIRFQQVNENQYAELCNVHESLPFAWSNYKGLHELQVEFFFGDINGESIFI